MDSQTIIAIQKIVQSIDWSAWVTAIATLILAILTFVYVRLTRKILESQSDPCIIVSVVHDNDRPSILQLVVKNIGSGLAHNISFEFSRPLPKDAWGLSKEEAKAAAPMDNGPLILGIPALGPGEMRAKDWGQYGGLIKCVGEEPITVTATFFKNGKKKPPVQSYLDIKSFEGTNASESPTAKIAKNLEKMAKDFNHLATGFHKPKVKIVEMPKDNSTDNLA